MHAVYEKSELVDWTRLESDSASVKSDELMRHVAILFALTADKCSEEQLRTYGTVLHRLADIVDEKCRSFAAEKLGSLEQAPYSVIRRFAFDSIVVADPILRSSPLLSDDDLVEISLTKGEDHMLSISMRDVLSAMVSDVLIESDLRSVLVKLVANDNAHISNGGMQQLKSAAKKDPRLTILLADRKTRLHVEKSIQDRQTASFGPVDLSGLWQKILPLMPDDYDNLADHTYLAFYDFEPSELRADVLFQKRMLSVEIMQEYAENDQFPDVICSIARLCGLPYTILARLLSSQSWNNVLSLFKIMGFPRSLVKAMLACGPWKMSLSQNQSMAIVKRYQQLSVEQAKSKVLLWACDGLALD